MREWTQSTVGRRYAIDRTAEGSRNVAQAVGQVEKESECEEQLDTGADIPQSIFASFDWLWLGLAVARRLFM